MNKLDIIANISILMDLFRRNPKNIPILMKKMRKFTLDRINYDLMKEKSDIAKYSRIKQGIHDVKIFRFTLIIIKLRHIERLCSITQIDIHTV